MRESELYPGTSAQDIQRICDNYTAFVEHCERIETMTGKSVDIIIASF
jgi:hypothetical protein